MLNFNSIMLNTGNVKEMAEFYQKVFDKKPEMEDGGYHGWLVGKGFFTVAEHSEVKGKAKDPDRVLFNFETDDVKGEFERVAKIDGITVVKKPYSMSPEGDDKEYWIATLADPDGNLFQLVTPWDEGK